MVKLWLVIIFYCATYSLMAQSKSVFTKDFTKPEATEIWSPQPKIVFPGYDSKPPSDAIVLFDGTNMDKWQMASDKSSSKWILENGIMTAKVGAGNLQTKLKFGNCQLHLEFRIPSDAKHSPHRDNAGNSGVFLQERYEVQIFNSYHNETPLYANGQTGSIYKQVIPMVNAASKPGEWDTFDIYYTAPQFHENGSIDKPAFITLIHNDVLTLNHFEIQGTIKYIGTPKYDLHENASIILQEHGSGVSFRNIWIREF